jgi:hypothetical protein
MGFLKADEANKLKRGITAALNKVHAGQRVVMPAPNPNAIRKMTDFEKAVAGVHAGRQIRKAESTTTSSAADAISLMHRGPAEFANRNVAGTPLVEKLVLAVGNAVLKEFSSKRELRKMIDG